MSVAQPARIVAGRLSFGRDPLRGESMSAAMAENVASVPASVAFDEAENRMSAVRAAALGN
jgi:ornithine carbamoyltransferase